MPVKPPAIVLALILSCATLHAAEPQPQRSEKATKLLKERLEILLTLLDQAKAAAKAGQPQSTDDVANAQMAVYSALLDLSSSKEERLKIYAQMLEELHKL